MKKIIFFAFNIIFIVIILASCANIVAPSGGEGKKTPPTITAVSFESGTTNFNQNNFTISFNSYMNRGTVTDNIIISPYIKYTYKWSGKELKIIFQDTLSPNTTYSIQLIPAYSDYYSNVATESFYIVFSTGNSVDTGLIRGKIIISEPKGYYIFCYFINNYDDFYEQPNSIKIDYTNKPPDYKVIVAPDGTFIIPALKNGKYRILAVKDIDKDGLVTQLKDTVGIPSFDPIVQDGITDFIQIIPNQILDIVPPEIIKCEAINTNEILVGISEQIQLDNFEAKDLYLFNKNNNDTIYPDAFYIPNWNEKKEIILCFKSSFNISENIVWNLMLDSNKKNVITDLSGNTLDLPLKSSLVINSDTMPTEFRIIQLSSSNNVKLTDSVANVSLDSNFTLTFNSSLSNTNSLEKRIKLFLNDLEIPLNILNPNSNIVVVQPANSLIEDSWYKLIIDINGIENIFGIAIADSIHTYNFKTEKSPTLMHFNGIVRDENKCNNHRYLKIKLKGSKANVCEYRTKINDDASFNFPNLPAGEYSIMYFCDINGNGEYDFGSLVPFTFAEPFTIVEQYISIKQRWSVDDYIIEIK